MAWRHPLLAASRQVASNPAKDLGTPHRTKATRYLLLGLGHTDVVFSQIVRERHIIDIHNSEGFIFKIPWPLQQISGFRFLDPAAFAPFFLSRMGSGHSISACLSKSRYCLRYFWDSLSFRAPPASVTVRLIVSSSPFICPAHVWPSCSQALSNSHRWWALQRAWVQS